MSEERVLASDIQGYYSRLNAIRSKFGLGAVSVPTITAETTAVLSQTIKQYDTDMQTTATQASSWITKNLPTGNLEVNNPTMKITDINIKQMLTTWEATCYHRSDNSDHRNYGDNGDDSDNNNDRDNNKHENERYSDGSYRSVCSSVYKYKTDS